MLKKIPRIILLFVLFPLSVFLTLNKHSQTEGKDHRQPIFSDAAGYYSYLPWFFLGRETGSDSLYKRTGYGFRYDENGMLQTKYPLGVALLQTPFFLVTHAFTGGDGFEKEYQTGVNISAAFWGCFGLLLLALVLRQRFPEWIAFSVPILIFFGTNLYWYMIDNTGMSHVYDFFAVNLLLYAIYRFMKRPVVGNFIFIAASASLLILIRPLDLPLLLIVFFAGVRGTSEWKQRLRELLTRPVWLLTGLGVAFLLWIPQLLYWKAASGSFFHYSYTGESFENLFSPKLGLVLFSTSNGWWSYSPLALLATLGVISYARAGYWEGKGILIITGILLYLIASWHSPLFGCAYGGRSFIALYPLLAFGLSWILLHLTTAWKKVAFALFLFAVIGVNMDMIYYYEGCFEAGMWNWEAWIQLLD